MNKVDRVTLTAEEREVLGATVRKGRADLTVTSRAVPRWSFGRFLHAVYSIPGRLLVRYEGKGAEPQSP
jgi:hypothetical protein